MQLVHRRKPRRLHEATTRSTAGARRRRPARTDLIVVVRNPYALPRAYVVHRTSPAPPVAELLPRLADPSYDPLASVWVEGDPGFVPAADAPARGTPARFVTDAEDVVEVETTAPAAGLLVLADTYASGWHATVDGNAAPIVPTNHLFRGVPVPAGTHRVRFTYRPWTVPVGQLLSLVGVALLAALSWRSRSARAGGRERKRDARDGKRRSRSANLGRSSNFAAAMPQRIVMAR